jgi:DNA sulfur modification protein DndE
MDISGIMKPPLESIRVSARSREILISLKRKTGIANWNIICRWAFCDSLSNPNRPVAAIGTESNIEMSWETFAGDFSEVLLAIFYNRAAHDGISIDRHEGAKYFRSHLERGISQLQNVKSLPDLFARATTRITPTKIPRETQITI